MPVARIEKQLVCSECGAPLRREPIPAAVAEAVTSVAADEDEESVIAEDSGTLHTEVLVEQGPVCPRCAGYR